MKKIMFGQQDKINEIILPCSCGLKQACKTDISQICAKCKVMGKDKK
jgi:hypothetical protein